MVSLPPFRPDTWTAEEKRAILEGAAQSGSSVSAVGRKYGINPNQLFTWRRLMREGGFVAIASEEVVVPASEAKQLKVRIRELERLLCKKTMEAEILKEAVEIAREKKLLSRMPLSRRDGSL